MRLRRHLLIPFIAATALMACRRDEALIDEPTTSGPTPFALSIPAWAVDTGHGGHDLNIPYDNLLTEEGVALGRRLFYETALSDDFSMSCASCHKQENAFSDPRAVSVGTDGSLGSRNAMSIVNMVWEHFHFWDARAFSLELQAFAPVTNPLEMRNTWPNVVARLQASSEYPELFRKAFGTTTIDSMKVAFALAQFERTLVSFDSPFDRYHYGGDLGALTEQQVRGKVIFFTEGHCIDCHALPLFTDHVMRNIGLDRTGGDPGLGGWSGVPEHMGKFRTPGLRNIAASAPYGHDGRFATLEAIMDFYAEDVAVNAENLDGHMEPWVNGEIDLDAQDRADLVAFMHALTDPRFLTNPAFTDPH